MSLKSFWAFSHEIVAYVDGNILGATKVKNKIEKNLEKCWERSRIEEMFLYLKKKQEFVKISLTTLINKEKIF